MINRSDARNFIVDARNDIRYAILEHGRYTTVEHGFFEVIAGAYRMTFVAIDPKPDLTPDFTYDYLETASEGVFLFFPQWDYASFKANYFETDFDIYDFVNDQYLKVASGTWRSKLKSPDLWEIER